MYWVIAFVVSLIVGIIGGNVLIPFLRRLKFGQEVREEGPQSHLKKQGTPTMGGIIFFAALPVGVVASFQLNRECLFLMFCALSFGAIGLLDDALKIIFKRSLGLRAIEKIGLQILVAMVILLLAGRFLDLPLRFVVPGTGLFFGSPVFYCAAMIVVLLGTTNAANLTDGLDGLLSSVSIVIAVGFFVIGSFLHQGYSQVFSAALLGSLLAFLFYNKYPAKVFMGDTGSFFIGGAVVGLAMCTKTELLLPVLCIIYVAEALSVMIQVFVFKKTGRRVFRMSPLHHHFELGGLSETQVVYTFVLVGILAMLLSVLIMHSVDPSFMTEARV